MGFKSIVEAEDRLRDPAPLTAQEVRDLMPWMGMLGASPMRRLDAELALTSIQAVRDFDENSKRIGFWGLGVNIALFALTIIAIVIALLSYRAAERSAKEQQKSLDSSRASLETAVENLKSLNSVMQEQNAKELERERRKPQVVLISVNGVSWPTLRGHKGLDLHVGPDGLALLVFAFHNTGDAPVNKPVVIFSPTSSTVTVNPNQLSAPMLLDMLPFAQTNVDYKLEIHANIPPGEKEFDLNVDVFGENLGVTRNTIHLRPLRSPA